MCGDHLLAAYEAVLGEVGVTDALPGPCAACGSRLGVRWPSGWLCAVCEWRYGELPDTETAPPRVDVVYYIRFADRVKIGTSSTPRTRLAQLRHEEVLAFEPGARDVEQSRHQQFADLRLGGEWFSLEGDLAEHIAALALAGDPWLLHARWRSELAARR
nr:GIY-YIG nuclease family protein [Cnuibacter physcomitrellae]